MNMPRTRYFDLTGQRFEKLLVIERSTPISRGPVFWKCICDCGVSKFINSANLRNGSTKSCGCIRKVASSLRAKTHGKYGSPEYESWQSMRTRCNNSKATNYHGYGGRGIKCCKRWDLFENFLSDMGNRPKGKTLDRIDVNGNYEPSNCRWATKDEQAKNKRQCKLINKDTLLNFLKTQSYLKKDQIQMIADNLFKNSHK
jgi:hypothetical protein